MPWLETPVQDQRIRFLIALQQPGAKMAPVCRAFQISRPTGYKWRARDDAPHGVPAVADRSRRRRGSPQRRAAVGTTRVVRLRGEYGWGGDKLARLLAAEGLAIARGTVDR